MAEWTPIIWFCTMFFCYLFLCKLTHLYRIRRGKKEMMDFLKFLGKNLDRSWVEGTTYSCSSIKEHIAKVATVYFKEIRGKKR